MAGDEGDGLMMDVMPLGHAGAADVAVVVVTAAMGMMAVARVAGGTRH